MKWLSYLDDVWKAVVAFITPGAVVLTEAVTDDKVGISSDQWWLAALSSIITAGAVWSTPGKKSE